MRDRDLEDDCPACGAEQVMHCLECHAKEEEANAAEHQAIYSELREALRETAAQRDELLAVVREVVRQGAYTEDIRGDAVVAVPRKAFRQLAAATQP